VFPLGGEESDVGPLGNLRNVPVKYGAKWETYAPQLVDNAIPFLKGFEPELVLVSAGYELVTTPCSLQAIMGK
jgi:acetoin utilization deacetylase AcuC-like enzyme